MKKILLIWVSLSIVFLGCGEYQIEDGQREGAFALLQPGDGQRDHFNEFVGMVIGPDYDWTPAELESLFVSAIDSAQHRVSIALENFESETVAAALQSAHERGVIVRVVADTDRLGQAGFQFLLNTAVPLVSGNGEILWQAEFGKDPVIRSGEDNQMVHNFMVVDTLRLLFTTNGLEGTEPSAVQFGMALHSEDLARDFEDSFDQMFGGVFSTQLTYFSNAVSSDNNRRSHYPTLDGTLELYFGPQEPVVKEVIDSIYAARSDVWIASPTIANPDLLNALRYKKQAGFDVRMMTANNLPREFSDIFGEKVTPNVTQTLIIIDGDQASFLPSYARGKAFLSSIPLIQSVPFFRPGGDPRANPVAQPSDRFIDGTLFGLHQRDPGMPGHFVALKETFRRLYENQ